MEKQDRISLALVWVAGISVIFAILRSILPTRFDEQTAMFLGVAVIALVIQQITKFKGFGIEFEKEVQQLKAEVKSVENAMGDLEKSVGPGSKTAPITSSPRPLSDAAAIDGRLIDPDDPNKGQFGGNPEANGRRLAATIDPQGGPSSPRCRVTIKITSTDPDKPLQGKVKLFLHPTFGRWKSYDIDARGSIATDTIVSYGAFTIGAEADEGKTRLELDLTNVPGGTERFYEQ